MPFLPTQPDDPPPDPPRSAAEPVPLIDNPLLGDLFATRVEGFSLDGGNVRVTLSAVRALHGETPPRSVRVVVGRLVMPPDTAQALATALYDYLRKRGLAGPHDRTELQ